MDPFQFREWFAILAVTKRANPFVSRGNYSEGEGGREERNDLSDNRRGETSSSNEEARISLWLADACCSPTSTRITLFSTRPRSTPLFAAPLSNRRILDGGLIKRFESRFENHVTRSFVRANETGR